MDVALEDFCRAMSGGSNAPSLTQAETDALAKLVNRTLNKCSCRNVQQCTKAIIRYVLPYPGRRAAFIDYVTSLSKSCKPRPADKPVTRATTARFELEGLEARDDKFTPPSPAHKRLHALYIIHNVLLALHTCKPSSLPYAYDHANLDTITADIVRCIIRLFHLATCSDSKEVKATAENITPKLMPMLDQYLNLDLLDSDTISVLRSAAASIGDRELNTIIAALAAEDDKQALAAKQAQAEATKWTMPRQHGVKDDHMAPWYELPAANGLYMRRTHGTPLRAGGFPQGGYPLTNAGEQAPAALQQDVTSLRDALFAAFEPHPRAEDIAEIDPLGNAVYRAAANRPTRNFWGFSYEGIPRIKANEARSRAQARGYDGVPRLSAQRDPFREVGADVQRARALAGGFGAGGGGRGRAGFGRGGGGGVSRGGRGAARVGGY